MFKIHKISLIKKMFGWILLNKQWENIYAVWSAKQNGKFSVEEN